MRLMLAVLLILGVSGISGQANARDKEGNYVVMGAISCSDYLDAYSRATLDGDLGYDGPHKAWEAFGWVNGFLTAYNALVANDKQNIVAGMSNNDFRRWVASWCRDNSSRDVDDALFALIQSR